MFSLAFWVLEISRLQIELVTKRCGTCCLGIDYKPPLVSIDDEIGENMHQSKTYGKIGDTNKT